ncbi:MAG: hypothetical protein OXI53_02495 [Nitrospira sp.]|nr:hypothetical protein [Nitrospira sp.]MDE0487367.1 hypothetical protein [Nitrospira sp.]
MRFIETPIFTEDIERELSLEEYRKLQLTLLLRPTQGTLMQGSGGLRKLHWCRAGMGKRSGLRAIYFCDAKSETCYMLMVYRKNDQENLTLKQLATLRRLIKEEFE